MTTRLVNASKHDGVMVLELRNPPANTYSYEMMRELDARMDESVHVLLLTGAARSSFAPGRTSRCFRRVLPTSSTTGRCDDAVSPGAWPRRPVQPCGSHFARPWAAGPAQAAPTDRRPRQGVRRPSDRLRAHGGREFRPLAAQAAPLRGRGWKPAADRAGAAVIRIPNRWRAGAAASGVESAVAATKRAQSCLQITTTNR